MYDQGLLKALKTYSYAGVDRSWISQHVLKHYWDWVTVHLVPMWIAPNLITLLGTLGMVLSFGLAIFFSSNLAHAVPRAVQFVFAALLWTYSTLDNVDGKQARRTHSSSPLGELFDHGCDALVTGMGLVIQLASLEIGHTRYAWLCTALAFWSFFLPTWEKYHTGTLYLGIINGPCEGILACCSLFVLTGVLGPQAWRTVVGNTGWSVTDMTLLAGTAGFLLYVAPLSVANVYYACKKRDQPFHSAVCTLFPFVAVSLSVASLAYNCDLSGGLLLFLSLLTVLFGRISGGVIYAHLLKLPFPGLPVVAWPLLAFAALAMVVEVAELWVKPLLVVYLVVAIAEYADWAFHVVNSFATYLGIRCFTLTSRPVVQPDVAVPHKHTSRIRRMERSPSPAQ